MTPKGEMVKDALFVSRRVYNKSITKFGDPCHALSQPFCLRGPKVGQLRIA